MWNFIFAIPFLPHGIAHISGFLASWTSNNVGYADKPWIFSSGILINSWIGRIFGVLWLIAMAGLIASAFGIVFQQEWWTTMAVIAASVSLIVIIPWWNTVPPGAKAGALFNLLVIAAQLSPLQEKIIEVIG